MSAPEQPPRQPRGAGWAGSGAGWGRRLCHLRWCGRCRLRLGDLRPLVDEGEDVVAGDAAAGAAAAQLSDVDAVLADEATHRGCHARGAVGSAAGRRAAPRRPQRARSDCSAAAGSGSGCGAGAASAAAGADSCSSTAAASASGSGSGSGWRLGCRRLCDRCCCRRGLRRRCFLRRSLRARRRRRRRSRPPGCRRRPSPRRGRGSS